MWSLSSPDKEGPLPYITFLSIWSICEVDYSSWFHTIFWQSSKKVRFLIFHQNSCFFISTAYILRALDGTPAERTFLKQRLAFGKLFQQMPRHFRISPSSTTEQNLPSLIQCTDDHERSLTCCTPERESKQPLLLCPSGKLWVLPASEIWMQF